MKPVKKIRVLLVDDHPIVREGIQSCLADDPRLEIVGEAADGGEAIRKTRELAPDVVLMDLNLPRVSGLVAAEEIRKHAPGVKVLALTAHKDGEYVRQVVAAGAQGFVLKDATPEELVGAILTVQKGDSFFSPEVATELLKGFVAHGGNLPPVSGAGLSDRERQVLALIAEGHSNKEIAQILGVGVRTVETHRLRLMDKLDIRTIAGLTKYAIAQRITSAT
jgi:DNA-binding NarL/FixJ family response regulator